MNSSGQQPELTQEDIETFRRCRSESFWRGCVPMAVGATAVVFFAQSRGFFLSRPKLRSPAYFLALIGGYLGGKLSYVNRCKSMFLDLDNSRVKDFLLNNGMRPEYPSARPSASHGPVVVETPVDGDCEIEPQSSFELPRTYAERREFFRRQQAQSLPPPPDPTESSPKNSFDSQPPLTYYDHERPLSSFLSEDTYTPRD